MYVYVLEVLSGPEGRVHGVVGLSGPEGRVHGVGWQGGCTRVLRMVT